MAAATIARIPSHLNSTAHPSLTGGQPATAIIGRTDPGITRSTPTPSSPDGVNGRHRVAERPAAVELPNSDQTP